MRLLCVWRALVCVPVLFGCQKAPAEKNAPASAPAKSASRPAAGPASASAGATQAPPFSGLVKLGDGVSAADVKPTDVLFVMARQSHAGQPGMLIAVQRHGKVEFPKRYEMSQANIMMPDLPFAGPFRVFARLDRDGDPMTKTAEDLYASFEGDVSNGQEGVHLVLNKGVPPPPARPQAPARHPGGTPASRPAP